MARSRRTGAAEDIIDLTALQPWWAGVALALVLYVVLHRLSAPVPTAGMQPGQIGGFMVRTMVATLAGIGQYLLPLFCLIGAAADGEKLPVQCKHWKAYKVRVVRELFGLVAAKGAAGGFVVTTELAPPGETLSDKLDRILTHKVWGTVLDAKGQFQALRLD